MDVLRLPYGPWKSLLNGKYEGYDVTLYQNPDHDLFSVLIDTDESGNPRGLVVTMYRGYLVDGPVIDIIKGLKTRTMVVTKKRNDEIYQFLLMEGGPKYIGLSRKELAETLYKLGNSLYKDATLLRNVAKTLGINVTALRDIPKNVAALILAEPVLLPNLIGSAYGASMDFAKPLPLGRGRNGETIKESIVEFGRTVIFGDHDRARKSFFRIIIENTLLSGIPAIILTKDPEKYKKMNGAGDHEVLSYGISPVGFPRRIWKLGDEYFIDLNFVDCAALSEAVGVSTNNKAFSSISEEIASKRGSITTLRDVILLKKQDKFHNIRAKRIIEEVMMERPRDFDHNHISGLLTMGDVGSATVISLEEDLWTKVAAQSLLAKLLQFTSKRGKSRRLRAVIFIEDADMIIPRVKAHTTQAIVNTIAELKDYGIGFVVEAPDEASVHKNVVELAETMVRTVNNREVGVRLLTKRPFRLTLRPFASNLIV